MNLNGGFSLGAIIISLKGKLPGRNSPCVVVGGRVVVVVVPGVVNSSKWHVQFSQNSVEIFSPQQSPPSKSHDLTLVISLQKPFPISVVSFASTSHSSTWEFIG